MNLHDELVEAGNEVLAEVHGIPAGVTYFSAADAKLSLDVISLGEVSVEDETFISGDFENKKKVEKRNVKVSGFGKKGQPWRPDLNGMVLVAGDATKWAIDSVSGQGTSIVTLRLKRTWKMEGGRTGRRQTG